jgi:hypothetical protein
MTALGFHSSYRLHLDARRRPTLPPALLEEAGIDPSHELVAHADGRGRLVLEDPLVALAAFQDAVAEGLRQEGHDGSLIDDLLAERAADTSFREQE